MNEPEEIFNTDKKIDNYIINKIEKEKLYGGTIEARIAFYYSIINFQMKKIVKELIKLKEKFLNNIRKNNIFVSIIILWKFY